MPLLKSHLLLLCFLLFFPFTVSQIFIELEASNCDYPHFKDHNTSKNIKHLLKTLINQSLTDKFNQTTVGKKHNVTGLYQCIGLLSNTQCHFCLGILLDTAETLCKKDTIFLRIQLYGCYLKYEVFGFKQLPVDVDKDIKCSQSLISEPSFHKRLEAAYSRLPNGFHKDGYYIANSEGVTITGQCQGDVAHEDCLHCLNSTFDIARENCPNSTSSKFYLKNCYLTYEDNGMQLDFGAPSPEDGGKNKHLKTEAKFYIIITAVGFGLLLLILCLILCCCDNCPRYF